MMHYCSVGSTGFDYRKHKRTQDTLVSYSYKKGISPVVFLQLQNASEPFGEWTNFYESFNLKDWGFLHKTPRSVSRSHQQLKLMLPLPLVMISITFLFVSPPRHPTTSLLPYCSNCSPCPLTLTLPLPRLFTWIPP